VRPSSISETGDTTRAEFVLGDVEADTAAIFLPTFTSVSRVSHETAPAPR